MGSLHRLFVRETGSLHRLFVRELQVCVAVAPAAYAVPELPVLTLISLGDADATDCVGPHADHGGSSRGGGEGRVAEVAPLLAQGGAGGGGGSSTCLGRCGSPTCPGRGWWWWLPYLGTEGREVVAPLLAQGRAGGGGSLTCSGRAGGGGSPTCSGTEGGWWWLPYLLREGVMTTRSKVMS